MLAENAALSIKCTLMALRFTHQISAIFSHVLKVSGNQCCKPILRLTLPTNLHAYRAHTLSPATELTCLHERKNARRHLCTCVLFSHRAWTLSGDAGALPVLQFQLLTLNQSFLIYLKGFVPWTLMPAPIRRGGQQQHNSSEKARANPCSDAIIYTTKSGLTWIDTEHKIILGEIRCAWHYRCKSLLFLSALPLDFFFPPSISPCPSSVIIMISSWFFNASDLKKFLASDLYGELILCFLLPAVILPSSLLPGPNSLASSWHR